MSENMALFKVANRYEVTQTITPELMDAFRELSGDDNPMHTDSLFAGAHGFRGRIAYGNLLGAMLSRLVGVELPTRKVLILRQTLDYRQPIYVGDEIRLIAEVLAVHESVRSIQLKLQFYSDKQNIVCSGQCLIKCL